jgi:hypothetical protein
MGFSQQCLDNIKEASDPPDNVPCTYTFCAKIQAPVDRHCTKKGISADTPVIELDPDLHGPGQSGWCYCCCSCFGHDTPLEAAPGQFVLVQDVRVSDLLMAANLDRSTGALTWQQRPVGYTGGLWDDQQLVPGLYLVTYAYPGPSGEDSRMIVVTADHLFLMDDSTLKPVQQLAPGDKLCTPDGGASEVLFVTTGSFSRGVHSVQMEGEFDGKSLDGHLLNANGIVCADYAVQVYYASNQVPLELVHASTADAPQVGTPEYAAKYPSAKLDAFLANEDAWPRGFSPQLARTIVPPAGAHSYLTRDQALDVQKNAPRGGQNNTFPATWVNYLYSIVRGMFPETNLLIDWTNELPNAYSWREWGRQTIVVTGGLARVSRFTQNGMAIVIAEMLSYINRDVECVGPASYDAVFDVSRQLWNNGLFSDVMPSGIAEVKALFAYVEPRNAGEGRNICKQPSLACRIEAYEAALSMFEIPKCAVPHVHVFTVEEAAGRAPSTVTVMFSENVDVPTAETAANYTITPTVAVTAAKVPARNAKAVRLTVQGLRPGEQYMVAVKNVVTNTGAPLDPQHDAAAFRAV